MACAIGTQYSEYPIWRMTGSEVDCLCASGMESPQHDSPKIGARHSPKPQKKLDNPLIPAITAHDTLSEVCQSYIYVHGKSRHSTALAS